MSRVDRRFENEDGTAIHIMVDDRFTNSTLIQITAPHSRVEWILTHTEAVQLQSALEEALRTSTG